MNIAKFRYFNVPDLPSAYWQIDMPKEFQELLSFTTPYGSFSFLRLVFAMKCSAGIFQMCMDKVISEANTTDTQAYQDDIILPINSFEDTLKYLEALLKILGKYNITLSPEKCQFHKESIEYLGLKIENHKISPISSNIIKLTFFTKTNYLETSQTLYGSL